MLSSAHASCPALQKALDDQKAISDQAELDKAAAWETYTKRCMLDKGEHNICTYNSGFQLKYITSNKTSPVEGCDVASPKITCVSMKTLIAVGVATGFFAPLGIVVTPGMILGPTIISALVQFVGIEQFNIFKSQNISNDCETKCQIWWANDTLIKSIPGIISDIMKTEDAICVDPCKGLNDQAYESCVCEHKDQKIWIWDTSKTPADCVACTKFSGVEKEKCLCENVKELFWYEKKKACVSKACATKKEGEELDKCVCEIENKSVWNSKTKTCNYAGGGSHDPDFSPFDPDSENTNIDPGYTTQGAASSAQGGSSSGGGAEGGELNASADSFVEEPELLVNNKKDKKGTSSWYKNMLGSIGFGGGSGGWFGGGKKGSAGAKNSNAVETKKETKTATTDILAPNSDDIFDRLTKVYTIKYRSERLAGEGVQMPNTSNTKKLGRGA